ncbi:MAG: LacI family DNA-binding transcriptional regulator [Leptothrix sp. (in: Bacteria)]|jgi:LacI family transcriptional regulator|nr:LacI family DNA-binding transcriptional regulator [Leptothrix sp. (in: b-proteobacteria)]
MSDNPKSTAPADAPRRRKAATIREVALAAGVSTATVSKFINGGQRFTREVEDRLTQVIRELGYVSNPLARGMITGQTGNVGIVILDILNPHFTSLVKGASRVAQKAGLNLLFTDVAEGQLPELAMLQSLSRRVDGLIVSSRLSEASIDWLLHSGLPTVYYGGRAEHPDCYSVGGDNYEAALMLGRHLRDLGHRRIAYVGFAGARWSADRLAGLQRAFEGSGAQLRLHDVHSPVPEEGERMASSVLLCSEPPDAVVAYNDLIALGLMGQAQVLGLNVPEDVSIAGFDNILYARYASPGLTSVDMASEAVGAISMQRLIERIRGDATTGGHETLLAQVMPRGSTRRRAEKA